MQTVVPDDRGRASVVFDKVSAFDFGKVLEKYRVDYHVSSDVAHAVLLELQRWLTLCVLHPEKAYGTGGRVDDMWHTFILFTKDYARFCQEIAGTFIHHSPEIPSESPEAGESNNKRLSERFALLEADYLKYFGYPPPRHIWPNCHDQPVWGTALVFLASLAAARN